MNLAIEKAINIAGSQSQLARLVGVDQSAVHKWLFGGGIRAKHIPALSRATNGQITVDEILASLNQNNAVDDVSAPAA